MYNLWLIGTSDFESSKIAPAFKQVYSTKLWSTNQNTVTVSFVYISSDVFVFTSETFETLWTNFGNLRKSSEVFGCFMVAIQSLLI